MAITFGIAPNPHWVIIDNFSKLPVGAAIYTFSSLNPSQFKPAYQAPNINTPFTQPIVGFGNGTMPPIYWAFDDSSPDDLYYIEVWDKVIVPGGDAVQLWTYNGLGPANAGGGGGTITTNIDIENLVINGEFYWNVGNQIGAPSIPETITLAPSNHDGFVGVAYNASDGPLEPDIIFAKSDQSASDSLTFNNFPQGDSSFSTGGSPNQPTPQIYVNYSCTIAGTETYKYFQFPIVKGLQNISNVQISVQMWNRYNGGDTNIVMSLRQFFGNGSNVASADVQTSLGSLNLSAGLWTLTKFTSVMVPSIAGKVIGNCGNDALYLQIRVPSSVLINFDFILPALYIGTSTSSIDFHTRDFVDAVANSPRTGDIRTTVNSFSPYGWVPMNDGTIGSSSSAATTRANTDTFALYDLIWNSIGQNFAPVSTGVRGASSIADFTAGNTLALTRNLGRVMAGALPVSVAQAFTNTGNIITVTTSDTTSFYTGMAVVISGGSLPTPLVAGTIYYAIVIDSTTMSLATTTANATATPAVPIVLTTNASGTITPLNVETLGSYVGEETHAILAPELPSVDNGQISSISLSSPTGSGTPLVFLGPPGNAPANVRFKLGSDVPHNTIQPTTYMNVFIKL